MKSKRFFWLTLALLMALLLLPPAPARAEDTYPLIVKADPPEGGSVTGGGNYAPNSDFSLVATPNEGWTFISWYLKSGDVSVNDVGAEWIDGRTGSGFTGGSIVAEFDRINADVYIVAEEGGAVNSENSGRYSYGDPIPLKATPDEGWVFDHWEYADGAVTVADPRTAETTASVLISGTSYITACFKKNTYPLTVEADPAEGGTVTGAGSYTKGQPVTLTATPAEGWQFKAWASADVTVAADGTFTMPAKAVAVKATFEPIPYPVTVTADPAEGGTVTGAGSYTKGQPVTLTATPAEGWWFKAWSSADVTVAADGTFTMPAKAVAVTATFEPIPYAVTVTADPAEGGSVSGAGSYTKGQAVTLTATPAEGWQFKAWASADVTVAADGTFTMPAKAVSVKATFEPIPYAVTVTADPVEGGTVTGAGSYTKGQTVTLTATPAEGWQFKAWASADVTVAADGTFTMPAKAVTVKATFELIPYPVTVTADPAEGGIVTGAGSYTKGQTVTLTATPAEGWQFKAWASEDMTVAENGTFTMPAKAVTVKATFELIPYPVTVTADPAEGGSVSGAGSYTNGQTVTLTATPAEGWWFKAWASEDVTVAENGTFTMPAKAVTVKAVFERTDRRYTVTVAETSRPANGQAYTVGESLTYAVTVTNEGNVPLTGIQVPDELNGARKAAGENATAGWTTGTLQPGESQTFNGQHVITLADALAGTLTFGGMTIRVETPSFPVTVACDPAEGGTVTGGGAYAPGETVTLIATANEGYRFKAWQVTEGNVTVGEDGTFVMPAEDVAVTAKFVVTYTLSGKAPGKADAAWAGLPRKAAERDRINLALHFPSASYEAGYRLSAITLTDDAGNVTRLTKDAAGRTFREAAPLPGADGVSSYTVDFDMPASNVVAAVEFVRMTLRWYDGDGSVLDEKYFFLGEPEPTTDKKATKVTDDKYSYVFDRWDNGAVEGDLKYYRPIFHQYPFYTIVEGAKSTYRLKSGKLLTIVVKRSANDETIVDDLTQVKLGKTLLQQGTDYEAKKGSLILHIKPVALNKLTAGTHHVTITFVDGEVQAKVKIKGAYDDYTGTGDNSHMFLWLALAAMGTMGLVGLRVLRKRQWE